MDSVSNFLSGLTGSLKLGAIRKCQFTVELRMDIFKNSLEIGYKANTWIRETVSKS